MTINIIIVGFCSLSQAIAFYVTFRLRARGRLDYFSYLDSKNHENLSLSRLGERATSVRLCYMTYISK